MAMRSHIYCPYDFAQRERDCHTAAFSGRLAAPQSSLPYYYLFEEWFFEYVHE